jgi:hypothetical protein
MYGRSGSPWGGPLVRMKPEIYTRGNVDSYKQTVLKLGFVCRAYNQELKRQASRAIPDNVTVTFFVATSLQRLSLSGSAAALQAKRHFLSAPYCPPLRALLSGAVTAVSYV